MQKKLAQRQSNLAPIAEVPLPPQPTPTMVSAFSGMVGGSPALGHLVMRILAGCWAATWCRPPVTVCGLYSRSALTAGT